MAIFEKFNFDIVIAIVIAGFVAFALYFRFKRQLSLTLSFLLPFLLIYFSYDFIAGIAEKTGFGNFIAKVLPFSAEKKYPTAIAIAVLTYFLFVIIIRLITLLFREPVEKQITNKDKTYLKIINVIMGLINGYAAIVLLMFVLSPVVEIDYERPVTAMVAKTSHPVFAVSFLNEIKAKEREYAVYREAFRHLSGEQAAADLWAINRRLDEVEAENQFFAAVLYPELNADAKALIDSHLENGDFISALLTTVEEKEILDRVIIFHASTAILPQLQDFRDRADKSIGYWRLYCFLRGENIDFDDFFAVTSSLAANGDRLSRDFRHLKEKTAFRKQAANFRHFLENYQEYGQLLDDEPNDFGEYRESFSALYSDYDALCAYGERFLTAFSGNGDPIIEDIKTAFKRLLLCREKAKAYPDVPADVNIVFASDDGKWYLKNRWEKDNIFRSYIIDAITNPDSSGYALYHRYIFHRYFDLDKTITANALLGGLDTLVLKGLLSEKQATDYLKHLLADARSALRDGAVENRLSEDFYEDLLASDHKLISPEIKQYLQQ